MTPHPGGPHRLDSALTMRRVNVIGTSCAGKSTFARELAALLDAPHVELDALHWHPGWAEAPPDVLRTRVAAAAAGDAWVVDGNYRQVRDLVWPRADTIVWLDYAFALVLWRSLTRTFRRVVRREPCCNGNRESLKQTFSRDSILLWVIQTYHSRRREFRASLPAIRAEGRRVVVLRSRAEARRWLDDVAQQRTA